MGSLRKPSGASTQSFLWLLLFTFLCRASVFLSSNMLKTSVLGSRQSQRSWMPEMDLSLFFCLCPGLYLLPHLDLQGKPGKPTQTSVFWFLQAEYGKYCSYFG